MVETIRAEVVPTRILFKDDETGFRIYSAEVKSSESKIEKSNYGNISIKGDNMPDFNLNSVYDLELSPDKKGGYKGTYTMHKSYFIPPTTPEEQWKFLSMVVTEKQYESISQRYSKDEDGIIDIIREDKFDYKNVKGFGFDTSESLKRKVLENLHISEALAHFSEYEIPYNTIKRIVSAYGSSAKAIETIEENPYAIISQDGFGFIKADELAMKLGIAEDSTYRIEACMSHVIQEAKDDGDTWILRKKLYNKMKKYLGVHKKIIDSVIDSGDDKFFSMDDRFALSEVVMKEVYLSVALAQMTMSKTNKLKEKGYQADEFIPQFEEEHNVTLSDKQREFLNTIDKTNVLFLIGNAGSGKSFLQKIMIEIAEKLNLTYALLAPTGKSSRVLANYTGRTAQTIHKRIGFGSFNEPVPIREDIVLVDEASMCDIDIAHQLMSLIEEGTLVVFIGDDSQIPSVGAGNFLFDCINSEHMPVVKLDKVFRQNTSGMLDAITMTRQGEAFLNQSKVGSQRVGKNFEFRHIMKERILPSLIKSYQKMLKNGYGYDDIGVLTPTNIGEVGTVEINREIQKVVNPQSEITPKDEHVFGSKYNERTIRVGDYVMNTVNMYDATVVNKAEKTDVFNGECGTVIAVNEGAKDVIVDFDGSHVLFTFNDVTKGLLHAWAITIHKSQGSQYKAVLVVVDQSAIYQLNANLLYTAMSRAQNFLGVFGQAKAFNIALKRFANFDRNSFLIEFLDITFKLLNIRDERDIEKACSLALEEIK